MLTAVPIDDLAGSAALPAEAAVPALNPEQRARAAVELLEARAAQAGEPEIAERGDYLALLRRWYYRPEKQRRGAILLPNADGEWSVRRLLNAAAREVLGPARQAAPVDREAAAGMKTKVIHEGREGVERVVPVLPKRSRSKRSAPEEQLPDRTSVEES